MGAQKINTLNKVQLRRYRKFVPMKSITNKVPTCRHLVFFFICEMDYGPVKIYRVRVPRPGFGKN